MGSEHVDSLDSDTHIQKKKKTTVTSVYNKAPHNNAYGVSKAMFPVL